MKRRLELGNQNEISYLEKSQSQRGLVCLSKNQVGSAVSMNNSRWNQSLKGHGTLNFHFLCVQSQALWTGRAGFRNYCRETMVGKGIWWQEMAEIKKYIYACNLPHAGNFVRLARKLSGIHPPPSQAQGLLYLLIMANGLFYLVASEDQHAQQLTRSCISLKYLLPCLII